MSRSESLLRWRACSGTIAPNRLAIVSRALSPHVPPFSSPRSSDHYGRSGAQVRDPAGARRAAARPRDQLARHAHLPDHLLHLRLVQARRRPVRPPRVRQHLLPHHGASMRTCRVVSLLPPRDRPCTALAPRRQSPTRFPRDRASRETRRDPRTSPRGAPRASDADAPARGRHESFTIVSSGSIAPPPTIPTPR